ncbi:hypothetical protein ELD05_02715 [Caldicellulosiruptor changbaiensis]|uniref:Uncharacterized protein n=1 Tax=Caldicellulosiruptor changbaiensis TaxID=1222016 RepID=A0A3T0D3I6_9FIRM|nr:hypothetical protein [Caldicellulosiruptor changbaiensis]AZT89654.1 hypothetical protein ELD05_02715 [Caldicellulosiruptor changbaiensis]
MSLFHYIAAGKELKLGSFGLKQSEGEKRKKWLEKFFEEAKNKPKGTIFELIDLTNINEDEIEVYDTWEDATGIYVEEITKEEEEVRKHFKNKFVYRIFGNFYISERLKRINYEKYKAHKKAINLLFDYISSNLSEGEIIEVYSCYWGEWDREPEIISNIDLNNFELPEEFELRCGEYIVFKKGSKILS